jgi:hypothetical protein
VVVSVIVAAATVVVMAPVADVSEASGGDLGGASSDLDLAYMGLGTSPVESPPPPLRLHPVEQWSEIASGGVQRVKSIMEGMSREKLLEFVGKLECFDANAGVICDSPIMD